MDIKSTDPNFSLGAGLESTHSPLAEASHVPGYIYTSPEILELEKQKIFMKDWLCVGRVEEFEKPGDFMTFRILCEPVIVNRDNKGKLQAFYNVCRHRGAEIAIGQGNASQFSCPYHGWIYDLEGNFIGAPFAKETQILDRLQCNLKKIKVDDWAGFVFINFDQDCCSLIEFLGPVVGAAEKFEAENCRLCDKVAININCNWKLGRENLADWYHVAVLHDPSFGKYTKANADNFKLFDRGGYHLRYNSGPLAPDGKSLFGPMPQVADEPADLAFSYYLPPSMNFFARTDALYNFVTWPTGPETMEHKVYMLFPEQWFEDPNFEQKRKVYFDFAKLILEEDISVFSSVQRSFKSQSFEPGPMVGLEKPIHHMTTAYLDRLFGT